MCEPEEYLRIIETYSYFSRWILHTKTNLLQIISLPLILIIYHRGLFATRRIKPCLKSKYTLPYNVITQPFSITVIASNLLPTNGSTPYIQTINNWFMNKITYVININTPFWYRGMFFLHISHSISHSLYFSKDLLHIIFLVLIPAIPLKKVFPPCFVR